MLDSIPGPIALVDNAGRHCYVNQAYVRQVGQAADQILGRTISEIVGADRYNAMRPGDPQQPYMDQARTGQTVRWEGWLGYPEGPRYVQRLYFPYIGDGGAVEGVFAFSRDVTDLKRSEEQLAGQLHLLQAAHAHLTTVLDCIPGRVALLDREERHRYVNREYADFVRIPALQLIGMTRAEVIGKRAAARLRPIAQRALAGETVHWRGWVSYRQGRRHVERVNLPHRNDAGEIDGYFNFARDLTDLKLSEAHNAAITASALDCIIAIDEEGRVVEFNPAAELTFGHRRSKVLGRNIADLIIPPGERHRHTEGLARYLRTGKSRMIGRRIEVQAMRADGSTFPAELAMSEIPLADRRLFTAYLRDLTAARQAASEIGRQRDALHQSEKMAAFGSLLASVAHELNNPLSIVIGNALMLTEDAEETAPGLAERAQRIHAAAERCGRITRSFLSMARAQKAEFKPASMDSLVDGTLQLQTYGLRASGIMVEREIPAGLPAIACDPDQIHQVLTNLVVNARQALEQQPQPRILRIAATLASGFMEITVADNGPGIPDAIRSRIFDPFFTTKPVGSGTGVGLSVSHGIAEAHGGSLALFPSPLGGAGFMLLLPARMQAAVPEAAAVLPIAPAAPRRRAALIVDDEEDVAKVLAEMLGGQGFAAEIVTSGEAAQAKLTQVELNGGGLAHATYDLVLCDLRLPGMDGPALYAWMEAHAPGFCARTAFVTGDTLGHAASAFLARAQRPVLEKPFGPAALRQFLQDVAASG